MASTFRRPGAAETAATAPNRPLAAIIHFGGASATCPRQSPVVQSPTAVNGEAGAPRSEK